VPRRHPPIACALVAIALVAGACTAGESADRPTLADTSAAPDSIAAPDPTAAPGPTAIDDGATSTPDAPAPAADARTPRLAPGLGDERMIAGEPTLLAVGDSLVAGTGLAAPREAFTWRVHRALAERRAGEYGLANLAVPGESSASLLGGAQLPAAREVMATREVEVVVLAIGGNDLLGLLGGPCAQGLDAPACATAIDDAIGSYEGNLERILSELRAGAPAARIVLLQVYNPFDLGFGSAAELRTAEAATLLNGVAADVAERHDVLLADGFAALRGQIALGTGMTANPPDIHPTELGHDRLAVTILEALEESEREAG
jgi:lysophospholipase L1-like esterase